MRWRAIAGPQGPAPPNVVFARRCCEYSDVRRANVLSLARKPGLYWQAHLPPLFQGSHPFRGRAITLAKEIRANIMALFALGFFLLYLEGMGSHYSVIPNTHDLP